MNNPPPAAWLSQIEGARSTDDLVRVLQNYVASLSSEERASLPPGCTTERISHSADIQEWAVTLAHEDLKATGSGRATTTLHQAAMVFAAAGARLTKVVE